MRQTTMVRAAALAICLAVAVAACGNGTSSGGGIKRGGTLLVGTINECDGLNPFTAINNACYLWFPIEYPMLVQYGPPGGTLQGDWATSWTTTADGLVWTFHLKPGGKWSDGVPLTAEDAVWTGNTILKYQSGPTAFLAAALADVASLTAPDQNTLVITYSKAVGNVLAQLDSYFYILPEHIWSKYLGNNGADLQTFLPQQSLPTVAGGSYYISQYQEKGTTIFKPNPYFYGPKGNADAITFNYYTNSTSMVADLEAGSIDYIDQVPFSASTTLQHNSKFNIQVGPAGVVTNITFNSNPAKPKHRELLDLAVKKAFEYATPRAQIVSVVFSGFARPWANLVSGLSAKAGWVDPSVQPLPNDPAMANQILDSLGYARGSGGTRIVPATTGTYAEAAHPMSYGVIVPSAGALGFDGERQFQILQTAYQQIGVKLTEVPGGDSAQAFGLIAGADGNYLTYDMATWSHGEYTDPNFALSILTKAQWGGYNDTGFNDPQYDAWYSQQATTVDQKQRAQLVFQMEKYAADQRPYIQLVDESLVTANVKQWTGFVPQLEGSKFYFDSPHLT